MRLRLADMRWQTQPKPRMVSLSTPCSKADLAACRDIPRRTPPPFDKAGGLLGLLRDRCARAHLCGA